MMRGDRWMVWWRKVTAPIIPMLDIEKRRNSRLLATLSLTMIALLILVQLPAVIAYEQATGVTELVFFTAFLFSLVIAYRLSRQGRYIQATYLIVGLMTFVVCTIVALSPDPTMVFALYYLAIPILLATAILPITQSIVFSILVISSVGLMPVFFTHLDTDQMPVLFLTTVMVVVSLLGEHRRRVGMAQQAQIIGNETRYLRLFEAITDGLFVHEDGIFISANPAFYTLTGYAPADLEGKPILVFIDPAFHEIVRHNIQLEFSPPIELKILRKNGSILDVEGYGHFYESEGKRLRVSTIRDVTVQKASAERAVSLQVEREHNALLRRFITDASHDLRTPLTVIFSSLHLLSLSQEATFQKRHLEILNKQAQHMRDIVDNLLSVSRLEKASAYHYAFERGDLNKMIEETQIEMTTYAEIEGVSITFDVDSALPPVIFDRDEMMRVIRQLLTNAISYTPRGGRVLICTQYLPKQGEVKVMFTDNGIGIDKAHLPHIFELFYRVDETRSTKSGGMGLGLAICKQVVESHRGKINVESHPGQGSTFTIILPSAEAHVFGHVNSGATSA